MTDLMEEAPVAWRVCNHDINGDPWPWSYQEQEPRPGYYSEVEPLYSASALAAAEQRGREEAAKIVEAVGSDHDPQLADFLAAAIRRGTGGANG